MKLYPRLGLDTARRSAAELATLDIAEARKRSRTAHPSTIFAPTGGVPVTEEELGELQEQIRTLAGQNGYPDPPTRRQQARWDTAVGMELFRRMGIEAAEATHAGVWAFVGCVVLPDLVRWRFPGERTSEERFLGSARGIRNAFGRLWWRAELLGAGNGEEGERLARGYMTFLGEDQLVQITERPAMVANQDVARAVASCYVRLVEDSGVRGEDLMREAVKRVRRRLGFVCWEMLSEQEIIREIEVLFSDSIAALRSAPVSA